MRIVRLPGLGESASAIAVAQLRSYLRTVKGKASFYFSPAFVILLGVILFRDIEFFRSPGVDMVRGPLLASMAVAFSLLGLQPLLLNLYATDGAGLSLLVLSPIRDRDVVVGKLAAGGLLVAAPSLVCLVAAFVMAPGGPPFLWLTVIVGSVSVYLVFAPAAALLSGLFPRHADLNSLGSAGNPHSAAATLGLLLTLAALAPPALLTAVGYLTLGSAAWSLVLVCGWALLSAVLCAWLVGGAAAVLAKRLENVVLVALGR